MLTRSTPRAASSSQDRRREVQSGRRRGNRTALARINRLIAIAIGDRIGTLDVRRQRHVADRVDRFADGRAVLGPQTHGATAVKMPADDLGVQRAPPHPAPANRLNTIREPSRSRCPGCTSAIQVSGSAAGRIRKHSAAPPPGRRVPIRRAGKTRVSLTTSTIARPQQRRQLRKAAMRDAAARAIHDHQPAAAPLRGRLLRDQVVRKVEIELADVQRIGSSEKGPAL